MRDSVAASPHIVIRAAGQPHRAARKVQADPHRQARGLRFIQQEDAMGIFSWIVLGAIAGWLGSMLVNKQGEGLFLDIVLGIVGALVGGWIFAAVGSTGVTGFNLWSLLVSVLGSVLVLFLYHSFSGHQPGRPA
jgi:uncharacterized membrane protein YeaQ/YmgE (transglycosylase-associated protein family)